MISLNYQEHNCMSLPINKKRNETNVLEEEKDHPPVEFLKFGPDEKREKSVNDREAENQETK
ncbi:unnamed protein product, partial [Trichogramma brassicae]